MLLQKVSILPHTEDFWFECNATHLEIPVYLDNFLTKFWPLRFLSPSRILITIFEVGIWLFPGATQCTCITSIVLVAGVQLWVFLCEIQVHRNHRLLPDNNYIVVVREMCLTQEHTTREPGSFVGYGPLDHDLHRRCPFTQQVSTRLSA